MHGVADSACPGPVAKPGLLLVPVIRIFSPVEPIAGKSMRWPTRMNVAACLQTKHLRFRMTQSLTYPDAVNERRRTTADFAALRWAFHPNLGEMTQVLMTGGKALHRLEHRYVFQSDRGRRDLVWATGAWHDRCKRKRAKRRGAS